MKNILYTFLLVGTSLLLGSCSNDEDTEAPKVEIINPEENQVVFVGDILKTKMSFKDDYGVRFYSYEIFHKDGIVPGEFTYKKEIEINVPANEFEISPSVTIPIMTKDSIPTATGDYILRVLAVDWYNNSNYVDRTFKIEPKIVE
ncbi:DUF4625 domain-containing protein [Paenimyroides tangerinum]|uniref:DUF4625 domain-containing protein n=1 Tax=Paenimyroides tangerinum TaxID=2488728 RepID=A0A3P3W247_9FLAO|nr:DUF4625 domain-containing protein [Paenimyroides tangerinum]RRJ87709.1 DUF4625 domain-containing protein [Paenimyroides tangerinum]